MDLYVEAACGTGADAQFRVVRGGDGRHDRQAEAEAEAVAVARAVGAESLERPQQPVDLGGWDRRPAVGHRQHGAPRAGPGRDLDRASGQVVADGVVHEVDHEALGEAGVAEGRGGAELGVDA